MKCHPRLTKFISLSKLTSWYLIQNGQLVAIIFPPVLLSPAISIFFQLNISITVVILLLMEDYHYKLLLKYGNKLALKAKQNFNITRPPQMILINDVIIKADTLVAKQCASTIN